LANVLFYAFWDFRFLLLIALVVLLSYISALLFEKTGKRYCIHASVIICIAILGVFKYFNFFSESFSKLFGISDHVTLNLILPLGISFYLFQAMSYMFDVLYGKISAEKDLEKLAVYISFFPQITSGPIVKSKDFLPQLDRMHRVSKDNVYEGIQLFLIGLTKKIVFADRIGVAVDAVYSAPAAYNGVSVLLAVIGYSFQIYCDFSGYSNMAIGIARIWDFNLGENFNAPYIAKNPSDFWRRWHISLSTWFRDYVYIPLGGSRKGKMRTYFNLFITMVLSGIWHGANFTYIVWGIVHGLGSALHKLSTDISKASGRDKKFPEWISIGATFVFVSLAWVVFRAGSVSEALMIYRSLFNASGLSYVNIYVLCYVILLTAFNVYAKTKNNGNVFSVNMNLDALGSKVKLALWAWAIVLLMYAGNSAFIYAQF
jgi:alginate O-acetyltransferase complex protein AlgI